MKFLITGGSGFIGSRVVDLLAERDAEVVIIGRTKPFGFRGEFIFLDLVSASAEEIALTVKKVSATHLLHFAWFAEHGTFWEAEENLAWIERTALLVRLFCEAGGGYVGAAGSCAEYFWQTGRKLDEKSVCRPSSLYGMSKFVTQQMVEHICNSKGVPWSWWRIFFPYGPGEGEKKFISLLSDVQNGTGEPFKINSPGERDFIHVEDVANAVMSIVDEGLMGITNVCTGISYDLEKLVNACSPPTQIHASASNFPSELQRASSIEIVGDNSRLSSIGWTSGVSLESYLGISYERS